MIKMVVSDFDMTLINYKDGFTKYQLDVLRNLKEKGIIFSIVTGRNVSFFKLFPELLEVTDYIISSNGGVVYDVKNNNFLFNTCIKEESLDKLISYGVNNKCTFIINELANIYKYGDLKKIDSIEFDNNRKYFSEQIIFYMEDDKLNKFIEHVKEINGVTINNIHKKNGRCSIDINNSCVSKGNSVLWLSNYLNISSEDIIAFGDGENDISMFEVVGKKICVNNACIELKKYADEVILSYEDSGVFKYIEENILK